MEELKQSTTGFQVGGLGEIAIRCRDLPAMRAFYEQVLCLNVLSVRGPHLVFYRLGDGVAGHQQVLALFASDGPDVATGAGSSLHHIALGVTMAEQARAEAHYTAVGQSFRYEDFEWTGWRGLFTTDPEGNSVELVAKVKEPAV